MRLSQIVKISPGYPFRGSIREITGSGVRAIQMKDVSIAGGIFWESATETTITGKRKPDWLVPGDILFLNRGNHNYAVLVDELAEEYRAVASPHFYVLRCKSEKTLPAYLVWLLNRGPSQRYFQKEAEGSLTKSLRREALESTPVVVPPGGRQQNIVRLAETLKQEHQLLDRLIRNNETMMDCIATDLLCGLK